MTNNRNPQFWRNGCAAALVTLALGLALTCSITSARWIGSPFPGFFVMANRVIASVSLPHWPTAQQSDIYQHAVIAVNGEPVASAEALYAAIRRLPPNSLVTYQLEKDGHLSSVSLVLQTFTRADYILLFVPYLLSGLALALIGIGVWFVKPTTPASRALLSGGLAGGLFAITGADLYGPGWFFRLHILGEAFFPAGLLVHLALVFPVDRLRSYRSLILSLPYLVAFVLGVAYEVFLYQPAWYSKIHNLCMIYAGIGGAILFAAVSWDYYTTDSHLIRQRVRVILLGFLSGFAFPGIVMLASGITGGEVAVNYAGFTVFLFPLSLGYAIVKHDLFEIDALLKRGVYYLALTAALTLCYVALLVLLNWTLRSSAFTQSTSFPLLFTLAVVLFLNPLKNSLQQGVDRVFFRSRYNPKTVLETTSAKLASTLQLEEILSFIWQTISETLGVQRGSILLLSLDKGHYTTVYPLQPPVFSLPTVHPLLAEVRRQRRAFSLYDLIESPAAEGAQGAIRRGLENLGAQLLVPLAFKGELIGLLAVGHKESGAFFSADDLDFLSTLANQSALSIANARAYQAIQEFNTALEQKVDERTQELGRANEELHTSLAQLEQAYRDLQRSHEHLLRAEKMAALGRLTAGIAHEMNTPLGASLSSLKLLSELVEEYQSSIEDREVQEEDHHNIAAEMDRLVRATQQWIEKAAAHIRSLKLHTRDLRQGEKRAFSALQIIEDAALLLSHRLRLSRCSLIVSCRATNPILYGDPSKLGQVLTNLLVNAIDAYKDRSEQTSREIRVEVKKVEHALELSVSDNGCGIPPEHLPQIFEEFFSTKPLGEGTGLGLSIARDLITNFFEGTISAESTLGQGSVFTLRLPQGDDQEEPARPPQERTSLPPAERL